MKLRLSHLSDVDPLRVPLPNGTEVTTRVDRTVDDRVVKMGAVGRIRETDGDRVVVDVVGVGEVTYQRTEIVPRKSGQLRFAVRRESNWRALSGTQILSTVVGSRAWGLADELSDTDRRGLFALPFSWTTGLVDGPTDLLSADGSETLWEVGKGLRQAIRADPNTLEMLFLPSAAATDEMGQWILDDRDAFASAEIYGTFGRYALSQLKRLRQSLRLAEHRELLMSWLADDPSLSLDAAAKRLAQRAEVDARDAQLRAKEYIKQLYGSLYDKGQLAQRDYASLVALAGSQPPSFELPRELRPKNAYNLLRLIATATDWLNTGAPQFLVREPLRSELLAIKKGEVPLSEVLTRADELAAGLEEARQNTRLPERSDAERVDALLRRIREELARRWAAGAPGPFGADAPELPLAQWD